MSGPEWTNDERPMTGPEAGPETEHVPPFAQANALPSEPAMAHDPSEREEAESNEAPASARPSPLSGFLALLKKIPIPSLGSERHEILSDTQPAEPQATAPHAPKRAPARFPFFGLRRETRVGIAALLSFVLLLTAFVVNKGRSSKPLTDKSLPAMAVRRPGETGNEDAKSEEETKKPQDQAKADEKAEKDKAGNGKAGEDKAKNENKAAKGSGSERKVDPPKLPEPPPTDPATGPIVLAGDRETSKPETPPKPEAEPINPTLLANVGNATLPPAPEGLPAIPSEPPPDAPTQVASPPPIPPAAVEVPPTSTEPPPTATPEIKPTVTETKPPANELTPAPTGGLPPMVPVADANPAPPVNPAPTPEPPPTAAPPRVPASAPVLAEKAPTLDPVPTISPNPAPAASDAAATATAATATLGAGWVMIPSGGRRIVGTAPLVSTPADGDQSASGSRVADGPRAIDDLAGADQIEPVVHKVRQGENFWTISKLYYRSGRYYKALWDANKRQVPKISELYVGTVLRIPPPEALDRSLIEKASPSRTDDPATSTASRNSKRTDSTDADDLVLPVRPRPVRTIDPEAAEPPRRPTYTVQAYETLRSIARDTLKDSRRDREIYNLNRDVLDDPNVLPAGTILTLPEDAVVGRRMR